MNQVLFGDCFSLLPQISDKSVDMILTDPPFNKIKASWESKIDLLALWSEYRRIIKNNGAILIFGIQPFSSMVVTSNIKEYKYQWVWRKSQAGNFAVAKHMPLTVCEDILVFGKGRINYYPQMVERDKPRYVGGKSSLKNGRGFGGLENVYRYSTHSYPTNILDFPVVERRKSLHPSQKSVSLLEYLVKTYTQEGDIVLDTFAGSGSTAIAAKNLNRKYIVMEKEKEYYDIILKRIETNE